MGRLESGDDARLSIAEFSFVIAADAGDPYYVPEDDSFEDVEPGSWMEAGFDERGWYRRRDLTVRRCSYKNSESRGFLVVLQCQRHSRRGTDVGSQNESSQ